MRHVVPDPVGADVVPGSSRLPGRAPLRHVDEHPGRGVRGRVPPAFRGGLHCGHRLPVGRRPVGPVPPAFRGGLHCGRRVCSGQSSQVAGSSRLPGRAPLRRVVLVGPEHKVIRGSSRLPVRVPLRHGVPDRADAAGDLGSSRLPGRAPLRPYLDKWAADKGVGSSRLPGRAPLRLDPWHQREPRERRGSSRLPGRTPLRPSVCVGDELLQAEVPPAFGAGSIAAAALETGFGQHEPGSSRLPGRAPLRRRPGTAQPSRSRGGFLPPYGAGSIAAARTAGTESPAARFLPSSGAGSIAACGRRAGPPWPSRGSSRPSGRAPLRPRPRLPGRRGHQGSSRPPGRAPLRRRPGTAQPSRSRGGFPPPSGAGSIAALPATLRFDLRGGRVPRCTSSLHSSPALDHHSLPHLLERLFPQRPRPARNQRGSAGTGQQAAGAERPAAGPQGRGWALQSC